MMAYTEPKRWKKEESERLRGECDPIKFTSFLILDLKEDKLQHSGKEEGKTFHS